MEQRPKDREKPVYIQEVFCKLKKVVESTEKEQLNLFWKDGGRKGGKKVFCRRPYLFDFLTVELRKKSRGRSNFQIQIL